MAVPLFTGNVIAVLWDFDQTLIPGNQQTPLFDEYGIDANTFWRESNELHDHYASQGLQVSESALYVNHMLTYARAGKMHGLTNRKLRELGGKIEFYPGMPDFLGTAQSFIEDNEEFKRYGITVEHYVVSTGLRQMILGSAAAPFLKGVWGCEFIETPAEPGFLEEQSPEAEGDRERVHDVEISQVGNFLDDTTKTRAVWEINKGVNVEPGKIRVNDFILPEDRRVPIRNMLYVADGPSDIPVFSIINQYGGQTLGVYNPEQDAHFKAVKRLRAQDRVKEVVEANYVEGTTAYRWVTVTLEEIAQQIVQTRDAALRARVLPPGGHVL